MSSDREISVESWVSVSSRSTCRCNASAASSRTSAPATAPASISSCSASSLVKRCPGLRVLIESEPSTAPWWSSGTASAAWAPCCPAAVAWPTCAWYSLTMTGSRRSTAWKLMLARGSTVPSLAEGSSRRIAISVPRCSSQRVMPPSSAPTIATASLSSA